MTDTEVRTLLEDMHGHWSMGYTQETVAQWGDTFAHIHADIVLEALHAFRGATYASVAPPTRKALLNQCIYVLAEQIAHVQDACMQLGEE